MMSCTDAPLLTATPVFAYRQSESHLEGGVLILVTLARYTKKHYNRVGFVRLLSVQPSLHNGQSLRAADIRRNSILQVYIDQLFHRCRQSGKPRLYHCQENQSPDYRPKNVIFHRSIQWQRIRCRCAGFDAALFNLKFMRRGEADGKRQACENH